MAHGEASIRIARPPDEVFAFVGDAANDPRWRKNIHRTQWLDDGPMRIGRRGRQTARLLGRVDGGGGARGMGPTADGGFTGPIGRILTRVAAPRMVKQAETDLETLRRYLESAEP